MTVIVNFVMITLATFMTLSLVLHLVEKTAKLMKRRQADKTLEISRPFTPRTPLNSLQMYDDTDTISHTETMRQTFL